MKKNILLILNLALSIVSFSQITITKHHLAGPGRMTVEASDENIRFSLPPSGANQTWDFTWLVPEYLDTTWIMDPKQCPGYSFYPQANIAAHFSWDDSLYVFANLNDSNTISYGDFLLDGNNSIATPDEHMGMKFPCTYLSSFVNSIYPERIIMMKIGYDPDTAGPTPYIDSAVISFEDNTVSVVTGWGTIKTPLGNYPVLQLTERHSSTPTIRMYSNGSSFSPSKALLGRLRQLPRPDTSFWSSYYSNDASLGTALVSYGYNNGDTSIRGVYWLYSASDYSAIEPLHKYSVTVYPNPATDLIYLRGIPASCKIICYNMEGRLVMEQTLVQESQISVKDLPAGLYQLQISNESNIQIGVVKVLKQ